jgi:hypothetical protein
LDHYCTLFDQGFLPQGLALHASLTEHAGPFTLWVICLDRVTQATLETLDLPSVRLLALSDCETPELLVARADRSYGEYCWTLASHAFSFVFDCDPTVQQLTYVDADVYFFASPKVFLDELTLSGKPVLITEHAYPPALAHFEVTVGRFCVQFVTFSRTPAALALLASWQRQARESTSARDATVFGDQKYLDEWPKQYGHLVHVLEHNDRTVAPWNADYIASSRANWPPIMYHFHGYRLSGARWTVWSRGYRLRHAKVHALYAAYHAVVEQSFARLRARRVSFRAPPVRLVGIAGLKLLRSLVTGRLLLHVHRPLFAKHDD